MDAQHVHAPGTVFSRILWLYGLYTLLFNAVFLIGYYWLPEGFMRGSPQASAGRVVTEAQTFWGQFGLTLFFNLGVVTLISVVMNFNQIKGVPVGYVYPFFLGITNALIAGTNSFISSDITQYNVRDGMALSLSIGNLEIIGYIFVIASTVKFGIYQYSSWWRWSGEYKPAKVMRFRDIRLSKQEIACLGIGILLVIFGAYRETLLSFGML